MREVGWRSGEVREIGEGEGPLLEKGPFPLPKTHPYPPKIFVRVGGGTGRLEKLNDGIRLPDLR